jgi:hypothetical protein
VSEAVRETPWERRRERHSMRRSGRGGEGDVPVAIKLVNACNTSSPSAAVLTPLGPPHAPLDMVAAVNSPAANGLAPRMHTTCRVSVL